MREQMETQENILIEQIIDRDSGDLRERAPMRARLQRKTREELRKIWDNEEDEK